VDNRMDKQRAKKSKVDVKICFMLLTVGFLIAGLITLLVFHNRELGIIFALIFLALGFFTRAII